MDWQLVAVALLVLAAACYLGWATWRSWRPGKSGCGGGCGCGARAGQHPDRGTLIPGDRLLERLRRSPRP